MSDELMQACVKQAQAVGLAQNFLTALSDDLPESMAEPMMKFAKNRAIHWLQENGHDAPE